MSASWRTRRTHNPPSSPTLLDADPAQGQHSQASVFDSTTNQAPAIPIDPVLLTADDDRLRRLFTENLQGVDFDLDFARAPVRGLPPAPVVVPGEAASFLQAISGEPTMQVPQTQMPALTHEQSTSSTQAYPFDSEGQQEMPGLTDEQLASISQEYPAIDSDYPLTSLGNDSQYPLGPLETDSQYPAGPLLEAQAQYQPIFPAKAQLPEPQKMTRKGRGKRRQTAEERKAKNAAYRQRPEVKARDKITQHRNYTTARDKAAALNQALGFTTAGPATLSAYEQVQSPRSDNSLSYPADNGSLLSTQYYQPADASLNPSIGLNPTDDGPIPPEHDTWIDQVFDQWSDEWLDTWLAVSDFAPHLAPPYPLPPLPPAEREDLWQFIDLSFMGGRAILPVELPSLSRASRATWTVEQKKAWKTAYSVEYHRQQRSNPAFRRAENDRRNARMAARRAAAAAVEENDAA